MTQEEFFAQVDSLRLKPQNKDSKAVPEIALMFNETKTIVRVKRNPKYVTSDEIALLAKEYDKPEEFIIMLFTSRKIAIKNALGGFVYEPTRRKAKTKRDATQ